MDRDEEENRNAVRFRSPERILVIDDEPRPRQFSELEIDRDTENTTKAREKLKEQRPRRSERRNSRRFPSPVSESDPIDPYPAKKWLKIPMSSVNKEALNQLGYSYEARRGYLFVLKEDIADEENNLEDFYLTVFEQLNSQIRIERRRSSSTSSSESLLRWGDLEDGPEELSFRLSRYRNRSVDRGAALSPPREKNGEENVASQLSTNVTQVGKVLHVLQSHYEGDGSSGGDQSAELKVAEDMNTQNQQTQSLFKWLQIEDISMNLDRFEIAAKGLVGLTNLQKSAINRLFKRIRKDYDKPIHTSNGSSVRFMTPAILSTTIDPEPKEQRERESGSRSVIWMCLPYFLLQKYSVNPSGLLPASHPVRTLLQTHSSFTQKKRDMEQAVCKLPGSPQEYCFHIAQVWCLVVDEFPLTGTQAFIITCSRNSIGSLIGKHIFISKELSSPDLRKSHGHTRSPVRSQASFLVSSGSSLWSIPVDECQTWFAFLLHFWEFVPKRLQFSFGGEIITANSWSKIMALSSKASVRIMMVELKSEVRELSGVLIYSQSSTLEGDATQVPQTVLPQAGDIAKTPRHGASTNITMSGSEGIEQPANLASRESPVEKTSKTPQPDAQHETISHNFHVFAWLNEVQPVPQRNPDHFSESDVQSSFVVDDMHLKDELKEIDRYLTYQAVLEDRFAYVKCDQRDRRQIYDTLAKEKEGLDGNDMKARRMYDDKVKLVNKAETAFRFFFPPQFQGSIIEKFWGALDKNLLLLSSARSPYKLIIFRYDPLRWLTELNRNLFFVKEVLSQAKSTERSKIELPEEFANAWIHFLMAFIRWEKNTAFQKHKSLCSELLDIGIRHLLLNMGQKSILHYSVFKAWDVASMANIALLGDITGQAPDIRDSYSQYLNYLESAIEASPLDRSHQDKLRAFQQEISVIIETLDQQRRNLHFSQRIHPLTAPEEAQNRAHHTHVRIRRGDEYGGLPPPPPPLLGYNNRRDEYGRPSSPPLPIRGYNTHGGIQSNVPRYGASYPVHGRAPIRGGQNEYAESEPEPIVPLLASDQQMDPTDANCIQNLLMQESFTLVELRIQDFREMSRHADKLKISNIDNINSNKDRQEAAIFVFTIVTVIFLPLSTVAGILGMNTNDVRNMEINQWVFWATAIPLTIIVITLCLIWTGELGNVGSWFKNVGRGRNRQMPIEKRRVTRTDDYSTLEIRRRRSRGPSPPRFADLEYREDGISRRVRYTSPPPRYAGRYL